MIGLVGGKNAGGVMSYHRLVGERGSDLGDIVEREWNDPDGGI